MSVKTILPIVGVGSAFAILGLAAARRPSRKNRPGAGSDPREEHKAHLASSVHPRAALDDDPHPPMELTNEFWDAAPESRSALEEEVRTAPSLDAYDALDTEDLTAAWLTRATQAPALDAESGGDDADDPAEIPADSLSMISDASRRAAAFGDDDLEPSSEYEPTRR